jgi:L-amino acid N-acyltransferase YncA
MYNAYTHPDYRGHRLFGDGVSLAARSLVEAGTKKIVTTVVSSNFASLRSCRRMGFVSLGKMRTTGRKERKLVRTPAAALNLGIQFGCSKETALAATI